MWDFRSISKAVCPVFVSFLALSLSGCSTVKYLIQATQGQLALSNRARPISDVLKDERTPPRIRQLLAEVELIKKYGEQNGIKPTNNYTEYVQLDRSAAVYVVSACEQLKFVSKEWKFPIVGRFPYLGWFDLEEAKKLAAELKAEGWDVDLRGASAYSTLGWFRDAVLSTMIPEGEQAIGDLVNVVIHESVHATLYLSGQAYFNESVASFVADQLTGPYLDRRAGAVAAVAGSPGLESIALVEPGRAVSRERLIYENAERDGDRRRKRLHETYDELAALYASSDSDALKLEKKNAILSKVKQELGYKHEISNATLIQFKEYHTGQSDFEAVWKACGGDGQRFMRHLTQHVTEDSFKNPQQQELAEVLAPVAGKQCL